MIYNGCSSAHTQYKRKLDKTETFVNMTFVRGVTETDFYICVCLYFQFDPICVFLSLFELVNLLSKQFNAFKAYILLLQVFS